MSHITVRWMPDAKPPIPPIMIETLGSTYIISLAEAKALALGLEQALASVEAGERVRMCICGGMPEILKSEPGEEVWRIACPRCRRSSTGWSRMPEAVRSWNERMRVDGMEDGAWP